MLHRDDVPFEQIEALEARLRESNPGARIVFLGDLPESEIPIDVLSNIKQRELKSEESVEYGTCLDCDASITETQDYRPGVPGWNPPDGWRCYADHRGRPYGWRCEICHEVWKTAMEIDENERWTITGKSPDDVCDNSDQDAKEGEFWDDLEGFDGK